MIQVSNIPAMQTRTNLIDFIIFTLMIFNKSAMNGPPMIHVRSNDLILSVKKRPYVCLLNPCFFSIWNVEYNSKGSEELANEEEECVPPQRAPFGYPNKSPDRYSNYHGFEALRFHTRWRAVEVAQ